MRRSRRDFLCGGAFLTAGLLSGHAAMKSQGAAQQHTHHQHTDRGAKQGAPTDQPPAANIIPVETPDVPKLPYKVENGVKVFHLVAEVIEREFLPGKTVHAWGYSGSMPGPTIEVNQGDRVRIIVDNHLPEITSMHWHGLEVPIEMDGVPGISQDPIAPGGRFVYEFTLHQHGTFFYHSHMPMQEMMGMIGLFIIHPKEPYRPRVDKDFGLILQEWAILPNNTIPNTLSMEFNWLTINGKAGPATTPLIVKLGERVRIRMVNLGMDHHPMHLHGNTFYVTGTEGGRVPEAAWTPGNTVIVGVAQARDIEFEAKYPGDWMLHCHLPHHMMNQMASMVGPLHSGGHGLPAGLSMEAGMGMLREGHALSDENGPSLGRGLGVGSTFEQAVTNMPLKSLQQEHQHKSQQQQEHKHHDTSKSQHTGHGETKMVPGYPQDMWMPMDEMIDKPETHGLRKGWTGSMMGMMTLVRVLPPDMYNKIRELQAKASSKPQEHKHHD